MSLVYLITSLPPLNVGEAPPIARSELIRRARQVLMGPELAELELLLLLDEVDETSRIIAEAQAEDGAVTPGELTSLVRTRRRADPLAPPVDDLPDFVLRPSPRHVLLRRAFQHFYREGGPFLLSWARFEVDLEEVLTGLLSRIEGLDDQAFLEQMEGHFDSASEVIVRRHDRPDLGLGRRFAWMPRVVAALEHADPVARERELDRLRWEQIEKLMGTQVFSVEFVLGYALQLSILEREASWDAEVGQARLEKMLLAPDGLEAFDLDGAAKGAS